MGLLNTLTFDGTVLTDFSTFISGEGVFDSPVRVGEMIHVPGRNGSLWLDEGCFENIDVEYPAFIGTESETIFREKLSEVRSFLGSRKSYCRIEDDYHPDEFRLGVFRSAIETKPTHYNRAGEFTIVFDWKPQRFLKSGETAVSFGAGNSVIENPTLFDAKPLIKVTGDGTVSIPPYSFTVSDNTGELWIDSELMEVYTLSANLQDLTDEQAQIITDELNNSIQVRDGSIAYRAGDKVVFANYKYPMIGAGRVPVRVDSGMTVTIYPRWWRL